MRNPLRLGLSVVLVLGLVGAAAMAQAQTIPRPLAERIRSGRLLFDIRGCSTCHTVKGKGGRVGPDLTFVTVWASPILGAAVMWNHVPLMEKAMRERGLPWPDLRVNDLGDIFTYLHSLSKKTVSAYAFRGNPVSGKALFGATCQNCHGRPFKGGAIGPDLGRVAREITSNSQFASRMLKHAPHMIAMARRTKIHWPFLTGAELANIYAYLEKLKKAEN